MMKKLGGVLARCFGNPDATEHARNLFDPLLFFQPDNRAYRATVAHMLGHLPLLICARRDLRQMRHTHHLVTSPQITQHTANNLGDSATDQWRAIFSTILRLTRLWPVLAAVSLHGRRRETLPVRAHEMHIHPGS